MNKLVGLVALAAATTAAPVYAQTVNFVGTTSGCFYTTVVCAPVSNTTLTGGNLAFTGGTFSVTTANGFVGVGNSAGSTNNFGSFALGAPITAQTVPAGTNFLLHILFTAPTSVSPNPVPFTAEVLGSVTATTGGYAVNFNTTPQNLMWGGGSGSVMVNPLSINNSTLSTATDITGTIRANQTTVPEPNTYLLVASGLAGLLTVARRRTTS